MGAALFGQMLTAFARDVGAGIRARRSPSPRAYASCSCLPISPELQPAEHLWPLTNEPLANQRFASLAELGKVQAERYLVLQQQPNLIRQHTLFHLWPTDA